MRRALPALILALLLVAPDGAGGFSNGQANTHRDLAPITIPDSGGLAYLSKPAAAAWNTMDLCAVSKGRPLSPGPSIYRPAATAYRTLRVQRILYAAYKSGAGALAAYPGTSNHGLGRAIDLRNFADRSYVDARGPPFGWRKVEAFSEWWHVNYTGGFGRPDPGTSQRYPHLEKGSGGRCQRGAVLSLQRRLNARGFHLRLDGEYGESTRHAVASFQHAVFGRHKRSVHYGQVGAGTTKALLRKTRHTAKSSARHAAGPDVRALQGLLNVRLKEDRVHVKPVKISGTFTRDTQRGLEHFQRERHIPVTRQFDQRTVAALHRSRAPPETGSAIGPDVSSFQGGIDWRAVRRAGASFAFVKATEGLTVDDSTFSAARVRAIRSAGLILGIYHFAHPGRNGAVAEARHFLRVVARARAPRRGDLPLVLDVELSHNISPASVRAWGSKFCTYVAKHSATHRGCITYTGGFWVGLHQQAPAMGSVLWRAQYGPRCDVPFGFARCTIWQFTDRAKVRGIGGPVDLSRFPRGRADLHRLARR